MNQAIQAMLKHYKCETRMEYERALKEILQEVALVGLWRGHFFEHAAFYGGTALRILHGLDRFSEDLDFTLLFSHKDFSLSEYNSCIRNELESYGFDVTVETKNKVLQTPVQSAFIKTNTLNELIKIGIPKNLVKGFHYETTLKIKVEVDTDPAPAYRTDIHFLKAPALVGIKIVILEDIFAGKMHALLFREWKKRVKGRDWYDWLWFVRKGTSLNLQRLSIHLHNSGFLPQEKWLTREIFDQMMLDKIESIDLESVRNDIRPFAPDLEAINSWTKEMFCHFVQEMKTF